VPAVDGDKAGIQFLAPDPCSMIVELVSHFSMSVVFASSALRNSVNMGFKNVLVYARRIV
jgi:hypothetical protein